MSLPSLFTRSELWAPTSSPLRERSTDDEGPARGTYSSSNRGRLSLEPPEFPWSSAEFRSADRSWEGDAEEGDRVSLRDPLMRTVRSFGAGVTKSFELFFESGLAFSPLDNTEPSLLDLDSGLVDPMRTIRGSGLPVD